MLPLPQWFDLAKYNVVYSLFLVYFVHVDSTLQLSIDWRTAMQPATISVCFSFWHSLLHFSNHNYISATQCCGPKIPVTTFKIFPDQNMRSWSYDYNWWS